MLSRGFISHTHPVIMVEKEYGFYALLVVEGVLLFTFIKNILPVGYVAT
jgi:hypothetical protein